MAKSKSQAVKSVRKRSYPHIFLRLRKSDNSEFVFEDVSHKNEKEIADRVSDIQLDPNFCEVILLRAHASSLWQWDPKEPE